MSHCIKINIDIKLIFALYKSNISINICLAFIANKKYLIARFVYNPL